MFKPASIQDNATEGATLAARPEFAAAPRTDGVVDAQERLRRFGPRALTDPELLGWVLGQGCRSAEVFSEARGLLATMGLADLAACPAAVLAGRSGLGPVRGCNITVPFKFQVLPLARAVSERATLAKAANVLCFDAQGWSADNTDGIGLVRDIEQHAGQRLAGRRITRQQAGAGHGGKGHGHHGLGVVGQAVLLVGVGPGPVEHVFAIRVAFDIHGAGRNHLVPNL